MWLVRYNRTGYSDVGFFSLCEVADDDRKSFWQPTSSENVPWGISSVYDTQEHIQTGSTPEVESEPFSWIKSGYIDNSIEFPAEMVKVPASNGVISRTISTVAESSPVQDTRQLQVIEQEKPSNKSGIDQHDLLYGNRKQIFWAVFVRLLLIIHNVLTVWRVVEAYDERLYWLMVLANLVMLFELFIVIISRAGVDYSWYVLCSVYVKQNHHLHKSICTQMNLFPSYFCYKMHIAR